MTIDQNHVYGGIAARSAGNHVVCDSAATRTTTYSWPVAEVAERLGKGWVGSVRFGSQGRDTRARESWMLILDEDKGVAGQRWIVLGSKGEEGGNGGARGRGLGCGCG
jgi:hypothetical protein